MRQEESSVGANFFVNFDKSVFKDRFSTLLVLEVVSEGQVRRPIFACALKKYVTRFGFFC